MNKSGLTHRVQQGKSVASLAYKNGLFWETVWNHPKNENLRKLREDHNILFPGDEVFIPPLRIKEVNVSTGKPVKFRKKGVPEKLNLQFFNLDREPYGGVDYELLMEGRSWRGKLDDQGWLHVDIPPDSQHGRITLGTQEDAWTIDLDLGHLDPITELTGLQARLRNLGYFHGEITGQKTEDFLSAVHAFRTAHGLEVNFEIGDDFQAKLKEIHGA